jgi:hypothetical protein
MICCRYLTVRGEKPSCRRWSFRSAFSIQPDRALDPVSQASLGHVRVGPSLVGDNAAEAFFSHQLGSLASVLGTLAAVRAAARAGQHARQEHTAPGCDRLGLTG